MADNAAAVAGGRNMADEYVMNAAGSNFVDMDVFAAGPVVRDLSDEFDHYWNSEVVYPVARIAGSRSLRHSCSTSSTRWSPTPGRRRPRAFRPTARSTTRSPASPSAAAGPGAHDEPALRAGRARLSPLLWARARGCSTRSPRPRAQRARELAEGHGHRGCDPLVSHGPQQHQDGVAVLRAVGRLGGQPGRRAGRGVSVTLLTNSLASTDEPWVYVGYWPHIHELLKAGVGIYELSPTLSVKRGKLGIFGHRTGALHMKNGIVDQKQVFLGSMNLDPRSARLNTDWA